MDSLKESDRCDGDEEKKTANTTENAHENSTPVDIPTTEAAESLREDVIQTNGAEVAPSDLSDVRSMDVDQHSLNAVNSEEQVLDVDQPGIVASNSSLNDDKAKGARPGLEAGVTEIDRWATQGFTR